MPVLKAHCLNPYATLCGMFAPNSAGTANCNTFRRNKPPTKHSHILK
ncbi:DUF6783 domain-containing protein [Lacrimispora sp.]